MTLTTGLATAAALAVAAWPQIRTASAWLASLWNDDPSVPPVRPLHEVVSPNYQTAIANLAAVRLRLIHTKCLGDDQKKAIDSLTLALVDGSDQ